MALIALSSAFRDAYRDTYRSLTETQIQGRLNQLFNSAITTAVNYNWGTDFHIFALCLLFDRPVFQYNTDLNHTLPLTDSAEQLSQRFLSFEEGTRTHLVYCTSVHRVVLRTGVISNLQFPPLALLHQDNVHWVAMLPESEQALLIMPIPRT